MAVVGSALGGAGNGAGGIAIRTMLQEYTPQRWMSLMMSLLESLGQAAPGLGFVLGGVLSAITDPRLALAVAGIGSLAYAIAVGWALRPSRIGEPPPRPAAGDGRVAGVPASSG